MKQIKINPSFLNRFTSALLAGIFLMVANLSQAQNGKLDDSEMTAAVEVEFLASQAVPSFTVDVNTVDGIVRLSGKVNDLLAKERAEKIAETVKGVRGVVNAIQIRESSVPDTEIEDNVETALLYNPATESLGIEVTVNDGRVSLTGTVDSWQEKKLAERVAMDIDGVRHINNDVEFIYESSRSDYDIKQDVEEALRWDIRLDDGLIDVAVKNGNVTLSGMVGSASEKSWAKIRAWVAGVNSIDMDKLDVEPLIERDKLRQDKYKSLPDEKIEKAVKDAMVYDPRVNAGDIEVSVYNGQAFLTGSVPSLQAKQVAAEDTWNVVGIWSVKNKIRVDKSDMPKDVELASTAKQIINNDAHLSDQKIMVAAQDGVIFLGGDVDSHFERYRAAKLASTVKGAKSINNNLKIGGQIVNPEEFNYYPKFRENTTTPMKVSEKTDSEIKDGIHFQYKWSPFVDENQVDVAVNNGLVTLEGTVDSWIESRYAVLNAYEGGAHDVKNNLDIEYDEYKEENIEKAGK